MAPAEDGYFYAAGFEHLADGSAVWVLRKLNPDGRERWCDRWTASTVYADSRCDRVIVGKDGSVIAAGHGLIGPWPDYDWVIRKYRPDGVPEWTQVFGGTAGTSDIPRALARMPGGGVLVAGGETDPAGSPIWVALMMDGKGRAVWKMSGIFSKYRCENANGAAVTADGTGFYLSGGPASGWMVRSYSASGGVEIPPAVFADALFETRGDGLTDEAKRALNKDAEKLKADPEIIVRVEGHADERGTDALNYELGLKRANRAVDYLVSVGIGRSRLIPQSLGRSAPAVHDYTEEAWRRNRRVHLAPIPMVREK